jgi:hypothetical protein
MGQPMVYPCFYWSFCWTRAINALQDFSTWTEESPPRPEYPPLALVGGPVTGVQPPGAVL